MSDNWASIELKHLRALEVIAVAGTFWAAAEQLSSAQSTLSDHVAALEALTGQKLIERSRGRRTVRLTSAGQLLLGHAKAIDARLRAAHADLVAYAAGSATPLRVGLYQSVANRIVPGVMARFRKRWPETEVQLFEALHEDELLDRVERGLLDVGFSVQPVPDGPFGVRHLMRDPFVLMVPQDSPLARHGVSLAALAELPMIEYARSRTVDLLEAYLHSRGVTPRVVFRSEDNATVQAMVAAGIGVAIAPLLAVDQANRQTTVVEWAEPIPPRELVAVWHRDRHRPAPAISFVEAAAHVAADVERAQDDYLSRVKASARGRH
jgi:DNA-binding transcriptional LysR family regulator